MHPASLLVGPAPPIGTTHDRWSARRLDRSLQRRVELLHPAELDHASGDRDKPIGRSRLQPHELEMLAQRLLVLAEPFASLAQTLPRLGGVGTHHRLNTRPPRSAGSTVSTTSRRSSAFLASRPDKSKIAPTIRMLCDLFHSNRDHFERMLLIAVQNSIAVQEFSRGA
jgi:hypothetical protein